MQRIPDWAYVDAALKYAEGKTINEAGALFGIHEETVRRWRRGEWTRLGEKTRAAVHKALQKAGRLPAIESAAAPKPGKRTKLPDPLETLEQMRAAVAEDRELFAIWEKIATLAFYYRALDDVLILLFKRSVLDRWPDSSFALLAQLRDNYLRYQEKIERERAGGRK